MSDTQKQPRRRKHTVESLSKIAAEYETRVEFSRANPSAYKAARRLGNAAYNQICSHMKEGGYKATKWTYHAVLREAQKYLTIRQFRLKSNVAYNTMCNKGWRQKIIDMMPDNWTVRHKHDEYYARRGKTWGEMQNYLDCMLAASNYQTKAEFKASDWRMYQLVTERGWLDDVCAHMKKNRKFENDEDVLDAARKFETYAEFAKTDRSAHQIARRRGLIDAVKRLYVSK